MAEFNRTAGQLSALSAAADKLINRAVADAEALKAARLAIDEADTSTAQRLGEITARLEAAASDSPGGD